MHLFVNFYEKKISSLNDIVPVLEKAVQSGKQTPYDWWRTEMMRKAPIRRLQKFVPKTADNLGYEILAKAVEHDNRAYDLDGYAEQHAAFLEAKQVEKDRQWAELCKDQTVEVQGKDANDGEKTE